MSSRSATPTIIAFVAALFGRAALSARPAPPKPAVVVAIGELLGGGERELDASPVFLSENLIALKLDPGRPEAAQRIIIVRWAPPLAPAVIAKTTAPGHAGAIYAYESTVLLDVVRGIYLYQ